MSSPSTCPTCGKRTRSALTDEERRERHTRYMREKYQNDPVYRERQRERMAEYRARVRAERAAEANEAAQAVQT
jgi:hypothetical protein